MTDECNLRFAFITAQSNLFAAPIDVDNDAHNNDFNTSSVPQLRPIDYHQLKIQNQQLTVKLTDLQSHVLHSKQLVISSNSMLQTLRNRIAEKEQYQSNLEYTVEATLNTQQRSLEEIDSVEQLNNRHTQSNTMLSAITSHPNMPVSYTHLTLPTKRIV